MKKIITAIIYIILCVSCSVIFISCNDENNISDDNSNHIETPDSDKPIDDEPVTDEPDTEESYTRGLEYHVNPDLKSYSVVGIGEVTSSNIIIPENYNGLPVTAIDEYAFEGITGLESIKLSKTIVDIGQFAFHNCSKLKDIALSEGLVSIQNGAFQGCSSLTKISFPESITYIGGGWSGCASLNAIYIKDLIKWCTMDFAYGLGNPLSVAHNLYVNGKLLTDLIIPEGVEVIGFCAFTGCTSLKSITIPTTLKVINSEAFLGCTSLNAIHITDLKSWCEIDFDATFSSAHNPLYYAKNLYLNNELITDLIIPNNVTSISDDSFKGCTSISSVYIPSSVKTIGRDAFIECSSLKGVYIDDISKWCSISFKSKASNPLFYAKQLFLQNVLVENLEIPNTVSEVGNYAFVGCTSIKEIAISKSCVRIGYYAFANCDFVENVIFENVYGWTAGTETGGNFISHMDLKNSKTAAAYLTQTYSGKFWKR